MIHALASHLWQSTLFAGAAALLTPAFRANKAQVRYCLWLSASVKFLIPFALLTSLGNHIQTWAPSSAHEIATATPALSYTVDRFSQPLFPQGPLPVPASSTRPDRIDPVITGVWLCGVLCLALIRLLRWRRIQLVVRASVSANIPAPVEIRVSPGLLEPAVVGSMRPVLLLPQGIAERLTPSEMNAVLDHELCHVRRRDNLLASIHMIVETMFWFHALVWWIGARLLDERERACDEDVVSRGNQPDVYAEAILNVCKLYVESPLPWVSGVTGSNLKKRIESIMSNRSGQRLNGARRVALGTAAIAAIVIPVLVGIVRPPVIRAQAQTSPDWQTAAGGKMAFEAASVKPDSGPFRPPKFPLDNGNAYTPSLQFSADFGLITYIEFAWKIRFTPQQRQSMRAQLPKWIFAEIYDHSSDRFAIEARANTIPTKDQIRLMMQSLLADRFQLKVHFENQETAVLALTPVKPGKMGPKLRPHSEGPPCIDPAQWQGGKPADASVFPGVCEVTMATERPGGLVRVGSRNTTMAQLAEVLSGIGSSYLSDRPLIDQTGITGTVDYQVEFTFQPSFAAPPDANQPPPDPGTTLMQALREQLGLKLVPTKAELRVLVIDHVERPSEN